MDLKFNGAVTQSWRSSLLGFFSALGFVAYASAEAAGAHPSVKMWALIVGAVCGALFAFFTGDHAKFIGELKNLAKAVAELQAQRQADAIRGRLPVAPAPTASSVPELEVPFTGAPATPQDTIPEAPPVAVPIAPKEPQ